MASQVRLRFVLDENVLILAQKQEDEHENADDTCLRLFHLIVRICHSLVVDSTIWNKYHAQLSALLNAGYSTPNLLHILRSLSARSDKLVFGGEPPRLQEEASLSSKAMDNVDFVRQAIASGAVLVTTDNPLHEELKAKSFTARYGLNVVTPVELLRSLPISQ